MKSLDLRNVKKVASDEHSTTLEHPSGHKIVIVHKHLSPKHKEALDLLPHKCDGGAMYADGGSVDDPDTSSPSPTTTSTSTGTDTSSGMDNWNKMTKGFSSYAVGGPVDNNQSHMPEPEKSSIDKLIDMAHAQHMENQNSNVAPQPTQPEQAQPQAAPQAAPQGAKPTQDEQIGSQSPYAAAAMIPGQIEQSGFNQQTQGQMDTASAAGAQGQAQAASAVGANNRLNDIQQQAQKENERIQGEATNVIHDMEQGHINPNQYLENMSTGSKITSALGILLGGFHGGAYNNPAQDFLNKQIDRNIQSQVKNLDQKNNVIHALMQQGHSQLEATEMMRGIEQQKQANEMQRLSGKFAGPLAQAAAQQFIGQRKQQAAQTFGNIAMTKAMYAGQSGQALGQQMQVPDAGDPNRELSYRVSGEKHYANTAKEAQDLQQQANYISDVRDHLKQIKSFNETNGMTTGLPTEVGGQADVLNNTANNVLFAKEILGGSGGVSRIANQIKGIYPKAGTAFASKAKGQTDQILDNLKTAEIRLKQRGMHGNVPPIKMQGGSKSTPVTSEQE